MEKRDIDVAELTDFGKIIACGTAAVVTPVGSLTRLMVTGRRYRNINFRGCGRDHAPSL